MKGSMLQQHLTVGLFLLSDLFLKGLTSIVVGPSMLNASLGKTLSVKCHYKTGYRNYVKYWCKGSDWGSCTYVVKTKGTEEENRVGRTVIKDNHMELEFTVRMETITMEDAGIYWCAIEKYASDLNWKVNITVTIELPPTSMTTTGSISTTSTFPTETTQRSLNKDVDLIILLPVLLGLLVLILGGTTLLMWKLKKKKVTKNSKVSPSSDQATDGTEVAYTTVIPTRSFAPKSQVSENTEKVDYASFRFSTLNDQPIYANA